MNWINRILTAATLVAITGCASQETVLPQPNTEMIDIYRNAMNQVKAEGSGVMDPAVICASIELGEDADPEECEQFLEKYAQEIYLQLDSDKQEQPIDYVEYTRTAETELDNLFPRMENPDIVIYVYPHLATRTRAPIPGYTTVIPLYNQIEYRLPGESLLRTPAPAAAAAETGEPAQ